VHVALFYEAKLPCRKCELPWMPELAKIAWNRGLCLHFEQFWNPNLKPVLLCACCTSMGVGQLLGGGGGGGFSNFLVFCKKIIIPSKFNVKLQKNCLSGPNCPKLPGIGDRGTLCPHFKHFWNPNLKPVLLVYIA
jgi:hypothetical protein